MSLDSYKLYCISSLTDIYSYLTITCDYNAAELQVQGMSFIAAVLLLNMDDVDTFICFANLLNKPCAVAFFRLDENLVGFLTYFSL